MDVRLTFGGGLEVIVRLRKDETPTTAALIASLPFESKASRWGEEVYFDAPFHVFLESDARAVMDVGEVAYWPDGSALALFFGRTPASTDSRPRAYSECNLVGTVEGDPLRLRGVRTGSTVMVSRLD
jgi:hypothetical protein